MSDTDDTDILLIIPPDFFRVNSSGSDNSLLESSRTVVPKPKSCTAQVIGKLVDQVTTLESRLGSLELHSSRDTLSVNNFTHRNSDTDSFDSNSLERKYFTFPRRRRRKLLKKDNHDYYLTSCDSSTISRRDIPSLKLDKYIGSSSKPSEISTHESASMDGDLSSIVSTPSKKNDKLLLNEIDEFLSKVEAYESPETKTKCNDSYSPENVIRATSDYISQKYDSKVGDDEIRLPSGRVVSSNILDKYIYLVKNNGNLSSYIDKTHPSTSLCKNQNDSTNKPETNIKTTEISKTSQDVRSPSIRRLNFTENKDVQPTSTPKRIPKTSTCVEMFKPTSNKIFDRASKVLEQYKASQASNSHSYSCDNYLTSPKKNEFKLPQMRPFECDGKKFTTAMDNKFLDSIDTDLLSLSDLWGEKAGKNDKESSKLEEERLKREHCETIIQQLQKKILEQQEKLAVAMKVDKAKDGAITKLRDAWVKLTGSLDKAEGRHRSALDKMVREMENFKLVADESQKKTNHFEAELYKALDLAHDYQEKCKQLTSEKKQMQVTAEETLAAKDATIATKDSEIQTLRENYETIMKLNKQSTDCVKNLEDALEMEKSEHLSTKNKLSDLQHRVLSFNEELSLIEQEKDMLKEKVNEERSKCSVLERQLCEKQNQCSDLLKKYDNLEDDNKLLRKHLELQKTELKSHYQKQLEDAVLSKLQEFQQQLDGAEKEAHTEAKNRENAVVDSCNKHVARIEEQHKFEINVLEEKQKEEIKLYRLQLVQAGDKISQLESKLSSFRKRRAEIASQLHGVMQAQWRQALLILTSAHAQGHLPDSTANLTQVSTPAPQDLSDGKIPPLAIPSQLQRGLMRSEDRETTSDTELQHYIKKLLSKPPMLDGSGDYFSPPPEHGEPEEPTSDRAEKSKRDLRRSLSSKPPWKA